MVLGRGMDESTGQEEAVASVFVERADVGDGELLGWVIQSVEDQVEAEEDSEDGVDEGFSVLDDGEVLVLDPLVAGAIEELSEADCVAEVSAGLDDEGTSEPDEGAAALDEETPVLVSPTVEDVKEVDTVSVVATSELKELLDDTRVSEDVTASLLDVSGTNDNVSEDTI